MRSLTAALVLGLTALAASAQAPASTDTSGWTTLRDDTLGFELRHPPAWGVGRSTGTLESVTLTSRAPGAQRAVTMQIFVQRGINPRSLPIAEWYADQLARLHVTTPPATATTVIGGRPTLRRQLSRGDRTHYDFYTAVNTSDVFQVSIILPAPDAPLDATREAVLATITFRLP